MNAIIIITTRVLNIILNNPNIIELFELYSMSSECKILKERIKDLSAINTSKRKKNKLIISIIGALSLSWSPVITDNKLSITAYY
ncbi:MAG: hypothetical protein HQK78_11325 [Desulfobacterales bacterium]|nr:hypothetical protein [Desulfobacterales bacterium]